MLPQPSRVRVRIEIRRDGDRAGAAQFLGAGSSFLGGVRPPFVVDPSLAFSGLGSVQSLAKCPGLLHLKHSFSPAFL